MEPPMPEPASAMLNARPLCSLKRFTRIIDTGIEAAPQENTPTNTALIYM